MQLADLTHEHAMIAVQGPRAIEWLQPLVEMPLSVDEILHRRRDPDCRTPRHRQPHRLHGRRRLRIDRSGRHGGRRLAKPRSCRSHCRPGWAAATRCGWKRPCRSTDTNCPSKSIPMRPAWPSPCISKAASFPAAMLWHRLKDDPAQPVRIGLELPGKRVPREGFDILQPVAQARAIGSSAKRPAARFRPRSTSRSPWATSAAMASQPGTELAIDIRGRQEPAQVVKLPFYRRK